MIDQFTLGNYLYNAHRLRKVAAGASAAPAASSATPPASSAPSVSAPSRTPRYSSTTNYDVSNILGQGIQRQRQDRTGAFKQLPSWADPANPRSYKYQIAQSRYNDLNGFGPWAHRNMLRHNLYNGIDAQHGGYDINFGSMREGADPRNNISNVRFLGAALHGGLLTPWSHDYVPWYHGNPNTDPDALKPLNPYEHWTNTAAQHMKFLPFLWKMPASFIGQEVGGLVGKHTAGPLGELGGSVGGMIAGGVGNKIAKKVAPNTMRNLGAKFAQSAAGRAFNAAQRFAAPASVLAIQGKEWFKPSQRINDEIQNRARWVMDSAPGNTAADGWKRIGLNALANLDAPIDAVASVLALTGTPGAALLTNGATSRNIRGYINTFKPGSNTETAAFHKLLKDYSFFDLFGGGKRDSSLAKTMEYTLGAGGINNGSSGSRLHAFTENMRRQGFTQAQINERRRNILNAMPHYFDDYLPDERWRYMSNSQLIDEAANLDQAQKDAIRRRNGR